MNIIKGGAGKGELFRKVRARKARRMGNKQKFIYFFYIKKNIRLNF